MNKPLFYLAMTLFLVMSLIVNAQNTKKMILINKLILERALVDDPNPPIVPKGSTSSPFSVTYSSAQIEISALNDLGLVQLVVINRLTGSVYNQPHTMVSSDVIVIPTSNWSRGYYTLTANYDGHYFTGDFFLDKL